MSAKADMQYPAVSAAAHYAGIARIVRLHAGSVSHRTCTIKVAAAVRGAARPAGGIAVGQQEGHWAPSRASCSSSTTRPLALPETSRDGSEKVKRATGSRVLVSLYSAAAAFDHLRSAAACTEAPKCEGSAKSSSGPFCAALAFPDSIW